MSAIVALQLLVHGAALVETGSKLSFAAASANDFYADGVDGVCTEPSRNAA